MKVFWICLVAFLVVCLAAGLILATVFLFPSKVASVSSLNGGGRACPEAFEGEPANPFRAISGTDAGMHAIWSPPEFAGICGYESWEKELLGPQGFEPFIRAGALVPLYLHSDGGVAVEIRVDTAELPAVVTDAERAWVRATSEEYLFVSQGVANLSGIEWIGGHKDSSIHSFRLAPGRYAVRLYFLEAPEAMRSPDNLYPPDFLVLIHPEAPGHGPYRTTEETFAELP